MYKAEPKILYYPGSGSQTTVKARSLGTLQLLPSVELVPKGRKATRKAGARLRTALFRPKAIVVTRSSGTEIVRYENLRTGHDPFPKQDWTKPIAMFPHKSVGSLTMKEFEKREAELFQAYTAAEAEFMKTKKLPTAFVRQYLELAHPAFLPFIKPLAPQFFAALGVEKP